MFRPASWTEWDDRRGVAERTGQVVARRLVLAVTLLLPSAAQQIHDIPPPPSRATPLRRALDSLRQGKTDEARRELERLIRQQPGDAEIYYQLARSHFLDFHSNRDSAKARVSLALAMEAIENTLRRNPDHINALKSKAVIHARAELLYYDPNRAYELGSRVAKLQPHASEYLLNLSEWMSGEVRFTAESGHRVPHDPLLGLDRTIELLDRLIDEAMPFSNEESATLFLMAKTLAKRGNFRESVEFFRRTLERPVTNEQRREALREMGASLYRMADYGEAARMFYQALQAQTNLIDQWLLRVTLDAWKAPNVPLPASMVFPARETVRADSIEFEDMAPELGVNRFDGNGTCAWGDYDGDGDLDLLLAGSGTFLALYRNDNGRFHDVTREAGLANVPSGYSLNFVDYDNDGRLDIYLALNGWSGPMANRLYRNTGGGKFVDVSKASGADDAGSGFVSLWGDLDNDGKLDFVVANGVLKDGSVPQIYRNKGDGSFANVTEAAGLRDPPSHGAIGIALGDYDRDGDLDLLINGLGDAPNRLYRNDGGMRFTNVAAKAGVTQPAHNGFVCFFLDYNNDAWPDILTTSLAPWETVVEGLTRQFQVTRKADVHPDAVRLFRNNHDGTFTDVTLEAGLHYPMGVMGAGVADIDNDGFLDLYFGTGDPQMSRLEPNRLFRGSREGVFSDVTGQAGLARPGNKGHGVTFVDIDEDGDLDVYAQLGGHYPGDHARNAFYRNKRGNRSAWLEIDLTGVKCNRNAVGATVTAKAGPLMVYREIKGSEGFGATNPYRVHLGLGSARAVDEIEVRWPGGEKRTFQGVATGQIIEIREDSTEWRRKR